MRMQSHVGLTSKILGLLWIVGCSGDSVLSPFASDGCSLFPDASLISTNDWCDCCFAHDIAYWRGGTRSQRQLADDALKACVEEKTQNTLLASLMYEGVRFGGSPYFYNWYRWGYGWGYDRKYQTLSAAEIKRADALLEEYFSTAQPSICDILR